MVTGTQSATTGKRYPMRMVLRVADLSSAAWYERPEPREPQKRGPKTAHSDEEVKSYLRREIDEAIFHGEGYKKLRVRANRRVQGNIGKNRAYRILREEGLLGRRPGGTGSARKHDGELGTEAPNLMWATDGKKFWTQEEGECGFFGVLDHFNAEVLCWHVDKRQDRFAAYLPLQGAVYAQFNTLEGKPARGVSLRTDRGSPYRSAYFKNKAHDLGIDLSPTWARSPESNGMLERFHRTLEEQVFMIRQFKNLAEAREIIGAFIRNYNQHWLLEEYGYRSPLERRQNYAQKNA